MSLTIFPEIPLSGYTSTDYDVVASNPLLILPGTDTASRFGFVRNAPDRSLRRAPAQRWPT